MGGLAKRTEMHTKLVDRYDTARRKGAAKVRSALKKPCAARYAAERQLLKMGWKTIGTELLAGAESNDIFKAEAAIRKLAPRIYFAVKRLTIEPRVRTGSLIKQT